ncbi:MAG: valine--tRNA ligase [Pseudomonadota bacterium]
MLDKNYDAKSVEPRIAKAWDDANAFAAGAGAKPDADPFCIVIPPPNVTGSLHMGHALNNTLQDILTRYKRMLGQNVLWQPGMDHAGIATQMVVERKLAEEGKRRTDFTREEFVEKIWEWKAQSGGTIFNQLKRLGASCDWSREKFTMGEKGEADDPMVQAVMKVFVDLYNEGLIYRGKRLVNWDPHFETAISDLEVENVETEGHMWHFKYPLADGATYEYVEKDEDGTVTLRETRDYISIATTRPETMLGDGAVAVHTDDERYAPIVGKLCEIPVGPKEHRRLIPIITDEYPDPDFGSGAVKITGAHDFNDYMVAKRNNIPMYRLMDTKAAMRADGAPYAQDAARAMEIAKSGNTPDENTVDAINLIPDDLRGLDRYEAREKVIEQITSEGLAIMVPETDPRLGPVKAALAPEEGGEVSALVPLVEKNKMQQPYGDRSKVVIEPMLTDQWFCDAETLAKPALASVKEGRTEFVPKSWENTYFNWMENIQPWCISRQLWWGHRIPAWFDDAGKFYVAMHEAGAQAQAGEGVALKRDEDVLDTWFSSALWPFSTLGWPKHTDALNTYYPTTVLSTAFDIIFFWVARMMMMGLHFMKDEDGRGIEPFKTVYIHPLVRDKLGQKMSKSKGNGIDPLETADEYGTDALRFTLAIMAVQGRDVKLDPQRIAGYRNFGTKLWNATRFAQMNDVVTGEDFDPATATYPLNRWILTELGRAAAEVTDALERYRFNDAAGAAYRFVWNTFCDWHLELLKPVFNGDDEAAKAEARAVAGYVLDQIYALLHPFMPFMTEELWQQTAAKRDTLLCHADWPVAEVNDEAAAHSINWLIELVSEIRSARSEMNIKPSLMVPLVVANGDNETRALFDTHSPAIERLARVESIAFADSVPDGAAQIVVGGQTICMPLAGLVDFDAEISRLEKDLKGIEKDIAQAQGKLNNEKFVANAPQAVIEENQARLADRQDRKAKVSAALKRVRSFQRG